MADTAIEWAEKVWNPLASEVDLLAALRWEKPRRVRVNNDLFHEAVTDEQIDRIFAVMALCPQHTFQVLTKRADRMREYMTHVWGDHDAEIARTTAAVNDVFRHAGHRGSWGYCGSTSTSITTIGRGTGAREYAMLRRLPDGGVERFYWYDGKETWTRCSDAYAVRVPAWGAHTSEFGWGLKQWPLPNVWLGVSVENQQAADERIPHLLATPAALRWISAEPLLGPVDLNRIREEFDGGLGVKWESALDGKRFSPWAWEDEDPMIPGFPKLDWVVTGGESGKDARPMHPDWARSLRDQCAAAGVPFFFKQWGEWAPCTIDDFGTLNPPMPMDSNMMKWRRWVGDSTRAPHPGEKVSTWLAPGTLAAPLGKKRAGRLLDGELHDAFPILPATGRGTGAAGGGAPAA